MFKQRDFHKEPFKRLVFLGESTVEGGGWVLKQEFRYADIVARLISECQGAPIEYINKGIGANAISPRSPGYPDSRKPSAMERHKADVIDQAPDLLVLAYGLNDMRAAMPLNEFHDDMATIIRNIKQACNPVIVLTTVYYMTGWKSWAPYDKGSIELTLKYNDCIRGLAAEFDCILADVWSSEAYADWLIHFDGVHANRVGNMLIAHKVFEAIAQNCSGITLKTFQDDESSKHSHSTTDHRARHGDPFTKTW